jgi:membrane dipeptidase
MIPIIDSHIDLSWSALSFNRDLTEPLDTQRDRERRMTDHPSRGKGTVSLPEMRRGRVAMCLATLLVRAKREVCPPGGFWRFDLDTATQDHAHAIARGQLDYYQTLSARGEMRPIRTQGELDHHWRQWESAGDAVDRLPIGFILAMEGADPILHPEEVPIWWDLGLRSVGLAHYGPSHYAVGTGDCGPLTAAGFKLLGQFEKVGMILDLTHSSDISFFQAMDHFNGPVMASHNNCRALVPGDRQFSDEQLKLLIGRGAVIGAVCDAWMLYPNYIPGKMPRNVVGLDAVADQIDHVCQLAGNCRHAAIGSDLDGGFGTNQTPDGLETIFDLQKLESILAGRGYSSADVRAIFHGNWLNFFRRHLPR